MSLNLNNASPQRFLKSSDKAPDSAIIGDVYYDTTYNVLRMFDGNNWLAISNKFDILGIMTVEDKEYILRNEKYFSDKIFLVINSFSEINKMNYIEFDQHVISAIENLGVHILWRNKEDLTHGLNCIFVENIEDSNLIRLSYNGLIDKTILGSQIISDLQA